MRETVKDHDLFQFYTLSGGHNMINSRPDIFMPQVTSALERMRLVSEVGKDMVDVIGDEIIMKDPPPTSDNSEEVKRIREELGIRKVE